MNISNLCSCTFKVFSRFNYIFHLYLHSGGILTGQSMFISETLSLVSLTTKKTFSIETLEKGVKYV